MYVCSHVCMCGYGVCWCSCIRRPDNQELCSIACPLYSMRKDISQSNPELIDKSSKFALGTPPLPTKDWITGGHQAHPAYGGYWGSKFQYSQLTAKY